MAFLLIGGGDVDENPRSGFEEHRETMRRRRTTATLHQGDLQRQAPALGASYVPPNEFEKSFGEHAAWFQRPQRSKPRGSLQSPVLKFY